MKFVGCLVLTLLYTVGFALPASGQDLLGEAKRLYDAASYSEALARLSALGDGADVAEVEKYRALCLLALDRPREAERALEHLAMVRPLFSLEGEDTSPKLLALFADVRKRTWPDASRQAYQRARSSFDNGNMTEAAKQFKEVLAVADAAPPEQASLKAELQVLAGGFLKLTEAAKIAADKEAAAKLATEPAVPAAAAVAPPAPMVLSAGGAPTVAPPTSSPAAKTQTPAPAPAPASSGPSLTNSTNNRPNTLGTASHIYDASTTARPPVAIEKTIPSWNRPRWLQNVGIEGLLQVTVDATGAVTNASMTKAVYPEYDLRLLAAARQWRFKPATVDGSPVAYRLEVAILVSPGPP